MAGGIEFKWFKEQEFGIQVLSTLNARKANQFGLPNRDRGTLRDQRRRARRYEIESEGLGVFLKRRLTRNKGQIKQ